MASKRAQLKTFEHKGISYKVGDNVLLLNEEDADAPFICKIEKVVVKGKDAAMQVKWFYRPEETCSGRRAFHSAQEVMASDHVEIHLQPAASIVSKCKIHTLEHYMELQNKTPKDFYSRFTYLAGSETFQPDQIAVFHPECLGYDKNEFRRKFYSGPDSKFMCDECQQRQSTSSPLADGDEDHETSETIRF
ncbi:MAG: DNA binding [Trebouxia sp. A1-2]|nr:MAG: DNA binding [Trebouxia sp. A1-2]